MKIASLKTGHAGPHPLILAVDRGGRPAEWINWQKAAGHYLGGDVLWTIGDPAMSLRGGMNRYGKQSTLELHPVIAIGGADARRFEDHAISLNNPALFARDRHICMYCGEKYSKQYLSRDHVIPRGKGGLDTWANVVTACRPCNLKKACRTPEEAKMPLLALPFAPSHIEGLILANKRILAMQMDFLEAQRPNARKGCQ